MLYHHILLPTFAICVAAHAAFASPEGFIAAPAIVGGNDANVDEYPYYVKTPSCGGVLIASEWVLTGAHCRDIEGMKVIVGAHKRSTTNGAFLVGQSRICTEYTVDPNFENGGCLTCPPFKNDFALCKLDTPVFVDDSIVSFRLNEDAAIPVAKEEAVAIGFGRNSTGPSDKTGNPEVLQEVTLSVDDNHCFQPSGNLCTSSGIERKSICFGDSGGPLLQKGTVNIWTGKRVDTHVGVSSFLYGDVENGENVFCGLGKPERPDVFARTSSGIDFIKQTICVEGNSRSPFCQTPHVCDSEYKQKLAVKIVTGNHPTEVNWTLSKVGLDYDLVRNDYDQQFFTYEDSICLPKGASFRFRMMKGNGDDGLMTSFYSLSLDGEEIKSSMYKLSGPDEEYIFTTKPKPPPQMSSDCKDDADYRFAKDATGATCSELEINSRESKKKRKQICRLKDPKNGQRIKAYCPSFCIMKCRKERRKHSSN